MTPKDGDGRWTTIEISKVSRQQITRKKRVFCGVSLHEHHQAHGMGHSPVPWLASQETCKSQRVVRNKCECLQAALADANRDAPAP